MNIPSINSNPLAGLGGRPVAADAPPPEVRPANAATQTVQAVVEPSKAEASREELERAVKEVNDFLKPINNAIQFNLDDDTGKTIVKVIDTATKDVIRQFPSEEMLSIAKAIDKMKGLLIQQKA